MESPIQQYTEKHRPQFHFSPPAQWMNDPNGMFYYEGEYHLFYQYYPDSNVWGPMHWGHAVSPDMIRWQHLPIGLYPDSLGYIFSGSGVVDWKNTSGFGSEDSPPLIAIFTYHDMEREQSGRTDYQYQGIAYSLDKGRTWTKYEGNPVLPNQGVKDFRDPKVFWMESEEKWIMTLAEWDHVSFYSSKDLISWEKESDFGLEYGSHAGVWECPDLFELPIEGQEDSSWVLLVSINPGGPQGGSATEYFVGDFDGSQFTLDESFVSDVEKTEAGEQAVWLDYGADNYAGVTWSDVPKEDGRRLFIGWMSNWQYAQIVPTTEWRSAMTVPRSLLLNQTADGYRVQSKPVKELASILGKEIQSKDLPSTFYLNAQVIGDFQIELANELGERVLIGMRENELFFDRTKSGMVDFSEDFPAVHTVNLGSTKPSRLELYVDTSSIEVFLNDGRVVLTELVFSNKPYSFAKQSGAIANVKINKLESIWD